MKWSIPERAMHPAEWLKRQLAPAAASARFIGTPAMAMFLTLTLLLLLRLGSPDLAWFASWALIVVAFEVLVACVLAALLSRLLDAADTDSICVSFVHPAVRRMRAQFALAAPFRPPRSA